MLPGVDKNSLSSLPDLYPLNIGTSESVLKYIVPDKSPNSISG